MQENFWYKFGYYTAVTLKYLVYVAIIAGIVWQLWNREVPFESITLMLTYIIFRRVLEIYEGLIYVINNQRSQVNASDIEKMVNMINFRNRYGTGPN